MIDPDPITARVDDPLSSITRKNRMGLLMSSLIAVLFVQAGLVPSKLALFGAEFENWDRVSLIAINLIVTVYFVLAFAISAISDYMSYRMRIFDADTEDDRIYEGLLQREADGKMTEQDKILMYRHTTHAWLFKASNPVAKVRTFVEFILPILIGSYAIALMIFFIARTQLVGITNG